MNRNAVPILAAALPLAWLVPNHYLPWLSAWQDAWAIGAVFLATLAVGLGGAQPKLDWPWGLAALLVASSLVLQLGSGTLRFAGDAWMVLLYVAAFVCSLVVGRAVTESGRKAGRPADGHLPFACGVLAAATLSVGLAVAQWLDSAQFGIWAANLAPGARPFGNLAQPNHMCTVAFLGLCALALLNGRGRIGAPVFWVGSSWLVAGMVMSGSRTGWLQLLAAAVVVGLTGRDVMQIDRRAPAVWLVLMAAGSAVWPALNDLLLLSSGRSLAQALEGGGGRLEVWRVLGAAVVERPLLGWGWLQTLFAQTSLSLDHPPVLRPFEYSHNALLDLVLWAGLPVGLGTAGLAAWAVTRQLGAIDQPDAMWLLVGVVGVGAHAMLEMPHAYAYFLLPCGVALGIAAGLCPAVRSLTLPQWTFRAATLAGAALFVVLATEYLQAEQNYRVLRFELARIGTTRIESKTPDLPVLNQLEALLSMARAPARAGMGKQELEAFERTAARYPYVPVLYRYAVALASNGSNEQAAKLMAQLCATYPKRSCEGARAAWAEAATSNPQLQRMP